MNDNPEKPSPEFERFNALVRKVLSVPKAVMDERHKEEEKTKPSKRPSKSPK
jgi:hypothetical protein